MEKEEFINLPYLSRVELIQAREIVLRLIAENQDTIKIIETPPLVHSIRALNGLYGFDILEVSFTSKNVNKYTFAFNPSGLDSNLSASFVSEWSGVESSMKSWIEHVKKLNASFFDYFNPDKKFYDEQFQEYFSNDEPNAATEPFDLQRQAFLNQFLTYAEYTVQAASDILQEKKDEIINELQGLKADMPVTSKKTTVSRLSKIAQKIFKVSNKAFYVVFDVLKKEIIKKGLHEGYDKMHPYLSDAIVWVTHLLPGTPT